MVPKPEENLSSSAWMRDGVADSARVITGLRDQLPAIEKICQVITTALLGGRKLLTAGNGGSAAESLHLAEELTGRYRRSDRRALPAISLAADTTALTCIANDWDFASVFSRQIEALAQPGDALVVFSTSGNIENLIRAGQTMRSHGGTVIGLLGKDGGKLLPLCDHVIVVNSVRSAAIQEAHQVILHLILEFIERRCP